MADEHHLSLRSFLELFGGTKGLIDSSVPLTVFAITFLFAPLNTSLIAAVVAGMLVVGLRLIRGQSTQRAFGGFFGLLIAVLIARSTGSGKGVYWPGIVITATTGVGFLVSLLVRNPVVALGLTALDPRYASWREQPALRRACYVSTAVWTVSFFIRAAVATTVLLSLGDKAKDSLLILVVINVVKWPLIIGSALLTVALVRQADVPAVAEPVEPA